MDGFSILLVGIHYGFCEIADLLERQDMNNRYSMHIVLALCLAACGPFKRPKDNRVFLCRPFNHVWKECAAVPLASSMEDAEAKAFRTPMTGKAQVYVVRRYPNEYQKTSEIVLNGKPVATIGPETYIVLNLDPGDYTLTASTDDKVVLHLSVLPGKNYYVAYSLALWLGNVSGKLVVAEEREGQSLVIGSKRAVTKSDFK